MKGYKALNKDMRAIHGNGMQYELGKKYTVNGKVILCENGFHFCKKIEYLNIYYDISDSRIFEIEAYGNIEGNSSKYVAESIRLVRELSKEEINDYFKLNQQKFVKSNYGDVRIAVAEQGYGLDTLVHDENGFVRQAVAKQGYGLDMLVHDADWLVRKVVAEQGYRLDKLVHDEDCDVRKAVAKQGYEMDELIHDKDFSVREVAKAMLDSNSAAQ